MSLKEQEQNAHNVPEINEISAKSPDKQVIKDKQKDDKEYPCIADILEDLEPLTDKRKKHDYITNIFSVIGKDLFQYDFFTDKIEITQRLPRASKNDIIDDVTYPRVFDNEIDLQDICSFLESKNIPKVNERNIKAKILKSAKRNTYSSLRKLMDELPAWDGKQRVKYFLSALTNPDVETMTHNKRSYYEDLSVAWWIGVAGRAMISKPLETFKFDYALFFAGERAAAKSEAIQKLCLIESHFTDHVPLDHERDFGCKIHGFFIGELSEAGSYKNTDNNQFKTIMSRERDNYQPMFTDAKPVTRFTIFIGTTNDDNFVKDPKGRRIAVVECDNELNIKWLEENKLQLYAEAKYLYEQCETKEEAERKAFAPINSPYFNELLIDNAATTSFDDIIDQLLTVNDDLIPQFLINRGESRKYFQLLELKSAIEEKNGPTAYIEQKMYEALKNNNFIKTRVYHNNKQIRAWIKKPPKK